MLLSRSLPILQRHKLPSCVVRLAESKKNHLGHMKLSQLRALLQKYAHEIGVHYGIMPLSLT